MGFVYESLDWSLKALINNRHPFALVKYAGSNQIFLLIKKSGKVQSGSHLSELNRAFGFLLAPFDPSGSYKYVLIEARSSNLICNSIDEVDLALAKFCHKLSYVREAAPFMPPLAKYDYHARLAYCQDSPIALDLAAGFADEKAQYAHYANVFGDFMEALENETFHKLVLSRVESAPLAEGFSLGKLFSEAIAKYQATVHLSYSPLTGINFGCSPELLLSGTQDNLTTTSLAGTRPYDQAKAASAAYTVEDFGAKNIREQKVVSDYIQELIAKHGEVIKCQGPYPSRAGNVLHLKTDLSFHLTKEEQLHTFIEALYPTPAVCGTPKDEARKFIVAHEGYQRGYYAGAVGLYWPNFMSRLFVNLRSMHLSQFNHQAQAIIYAGGGILKDSEVENEFQETKHKMQAMKTLLQLASA